MKQKLRAIVIDDMELCRDLLGEIMTDRGYQALTFPDVTVCSHFLNDTGCTRSTACADILLLDNRMSPLKGLDLLELHRRGNCHIPLTSKAIFSGSWTAAELKRVEQLGCQFFHKPYDFEELSLWLSQQEKSIRSDRELVNVDDIRGGDRAS